MGGTSWIGPAVRLGMAGAAAYQGYRRNSTRYNSTGGDVGACTLTRRSRRIGRRRRRNTKSVFNSLIGGGNIRIYRWQQCSPNILGPGRLSLGWSNGVGGDLNFQRHPIHFMSITQQNQGQSNYAKGCFAEGMKALFYNSTVGAYSAGYIPSQDNVGATGVSTVWRDEYRDHSLSASGRTYHAWTDIQMCLYGTLTVPITYHVYLMKFDQQHDPQSFSNLAFGLGSEVNNMFRDMNRHLCGNVIIGNGREDWIKDVTILKHEAITLQPLTYGDQKAENELQGNFASTAAVHKLKWFVRHDRFRDYKWAENVEDDVIDLDFTSPGWDVNSPLVSMSDCEWGKKVYLFITATSPTPENGTLNDSFFTSDNPGWNIRQGSYDICVRNKFVYFG